MWADFCIIKIDRDFRPYLIYQNVFQESRPKFEKAENKYISLISYLITIIKDEWQVVS